MPTDRFVVGGAQPVDLGPVIRDLRKVDRALPKVIQQANKALASEVSEHAKDRLPGLAGSASSMVRSQAAKGIRPRARQRSASIALLGSNPFVRAFEFGTRYHFLPWSRQRVLASTMSRRVFPQWIGNRFDGGDWRDGLHGKSGHMVAPAVARGIDTGDFNEKYADYIDRAFALAFPEAT